ncbi:MAG: glycosyl transferase family 2 [Ahrensia sp.]
MITIVVPTHNDEAALARMLPPLVSEVVNGTVTDVLVYDQGSSDQTAGVCEIAGCKFMDANKASIATLIEAARTSWLLLLPPGAILSAGWHAHVSEFIARNHGAAGPATFKLAVDPNQPWWRRFTGIPHKGHAYLPRGFLISTRQAKANIGDNTGSDLSALMRGRAARRLRAEIYVPVAAN